MEVLILGDGILATELVKQTGWAYISRKKNGFDFTAPGSYLHLLESYNIIVNCIANTDTYSQESNNVWETNYSAVIDLANHCTLTGKKLVHISTGFVYANSKPDISEEELPAPQQTHYAHSKLAADIYLKHRCNKCLIIRTVHKPKPFPHTAAFINQVGNFDYVDKIAELIVKLVDKQAQGVYNVGTELKTMFDLAIQTNPHTQKARISNTLTPIDVSMDLTKMKTLLYENSFSQ
jgi:dTDP-4-dehydrorhamnose reductase